jgi:cytochrome bd-type quinol oxidase subunit 2
VLVTRRSGRLKMMRAGHVLCIAAGIVFGIGAVLPWAQLFTPDRSFTAWQLGLYGPLAVVSVVAVALVVSGGMQHGWAAFVAISATLAGILVELAVHLDPYQALTRLGFDVGGDIGHVGGFGLTVLFAGAALAMVAAVTTAIEMEPKVVVSAPGTHSRGGMHRPSREAQ